MNYLSTNHNLKMVEPEIIMMEKWEGVEIMDKFDVEVMELIKYVMENLSRYLLYQL